MINLHGIYADIHIQANNPIYLTSGKETRFDLRAQDTTPCELENQNAKSLIWSSQITSECSMGHSISWKVILQRPRQPNYPIRIWFYECLRAEVKPKGKKNTKTLALVLHLASRLYTCILGALPSTNWQQQESYHPMELKCAAPIRKHTTLASWIWHSSVTGSTNMWVRSYSRATNWCWKLFLFLFSNALAKN